MTVETRYMRSDQHTINTLTAYKLLTSESASLIELTGCTVDESPQYFYIGIRIYILHADGSETEVTTGTSVAIAPLGTGADTTTTTNMTWTDSQDRNLVSSDAIKIVVKCCCGLAWNEDAAVTLATFVTEQLGANKLNQNQWTVYYRVRRDRVYYKPLTWWDYYFRRGIAGDDSYITGFKWTAAVAPKHPIGDGLTFAI